MKYQRKVFRSYCWDLGATIDSLPGKENHQDLDFKSPWEPLLSADTSALVFWHLNAAISIEIALVGEGWHSSCSFKRAAVFYRLNDFNMRACQETYHVCAIHNREQGLLVLQEKVCSAISIIIPAIFWDISASFYSCPCHTDFGRIGCFYGRK